MKKAIIYARVSTIDKQDTARQVHDLKEYAAYRKFNVAKVFEEKVSGGVEAKERPEFKKLLDYVDKNNDISEILVYEVSRLGRSMLDVVNTIEHFCKKGINIFAKKEGFNTLNEKGQKDLMTNILISILSGFAQMERETMKARSKSGIRFKVSQGYTGTGGIKPYGYMVDDENKVVVDPTEKKVVRLIFDKYLSGLGTQQIAHFLNNEGVPTKFQKHYSGKTIKTRYGRKKEAKDFAWKDGTIYGILTQTAYIGERNHKGEVFKIEPIIEKSKFNKVQEMLTKKSNKSDSKIRFFNPFDNQFLTCGYCGRKYHLHKREDGRDNAYKCSSKRDFNKKYGDLYCGNSPINYNRLIKAVHFASQIYVTSDYVKSKTDLKSSIDISLENTSIEKDNTVKEIESLQKQSDKLIKLNITDQLSAKQFTAMNTEIISKLKGLNQKLKLIESEIGNLQKARAPKNRTVEFFNINNIGEYVRELLAGITIYGVESSKLEEQFELRKDDNLVLMQLRGIIDWDNKPSIMNFVLSRRTNKIAIAHLPKGWSKESIMKGNFKISGLTEIDSDKLTLNLTV